MLPQAGSFSTTGAVIYILSCINCDWHESEHVSHKQDQPMRIANGEVGILFLGSCSMQLFVRPALLS